MYNYKQEQWACGDGKEKVKMRIPFKSICFFERKTQKNKDYFKDLEEHIERRNKKKLRKSNWQDQERVRNYCLHLSVDYPKSKIQKVGMKERGKAKKEDWRDFGIVFKVLVLPS